jgi:hypothetical protein
VSGYDPVALWENRFTDADRNHPFYNAIACAGYYSGIKAGALPGGFLWD